VSEPDAPRALVFGRGLSGEAAAELLAAQGWRVTVLEGDDVFPQDLAGVARCVTSPGVPLDHPWQRAARAAGLIVMSELQLGVETWRAMGGRLLAVTGSKGKSSVVKLVAEGLAGVPCGNYGLPLARLCANHLRARTPPAALPWAVVEISSFQLETTALPADAFVAAALLNLQDDHLDRHGSREAYHALKRRLLAMTTTPIDGTCRADADTALLRGSYFDNAVLRANGSCAVALLRATGLGEAGIAAAFAAFKPLPHRFECVGIFGNVRYVDDSKATSLAALAAGVAMAEGPVRLIAGGLAKGDDPNSVIPRLHSGVKKVYLIGRCANQFFAAWRETVPCEICETLDRAVEAARRDALPGETVLLSPGTASFDQFKSYGARGDRFASLVREGMGLEAGVAEKK